MKGGEREVASENGGAVARRGHEHCTDNVARGHRRQADPSVPESELNQGASLGTGPFNCFGRKMDLASEARLQD